MEVSAQIYGIYLEYVSPEDIHAYSVDECFIDATPYLKLYRQTARGFAKTLMDTVRSRTGIYATAGIGPNLVSRESGAGYHRQARGRWHRGT